jgi:para-aminobenzoate synthetase component 1
MPDEIDLPFPLGGAFGYWGYNLRRFVEPRLGPGPEDDLELPECWIGFHDSLAVFDHREGCTWVVSTGLRPDGSRDQAAARRAADRWHLLLSRQSTPGEDPPGRSGSPTGIRPAAGDPGITSSFSRESFCDAVLAAQRYIRTGDIYQVNLSQRLSAPLAEDPWLFFERLAGLSAAPFAAYLDAGDFQVASVSPELFLRVSGQHVLTRPIKGTRPRSPDATADARFTYELQTSRKELAELLMITDLLRNDLGRVCEFGSIRVPDLMRLEKFPQVQHLVSTVEGRLRAGVTHPAALEACFPGGSITGAPKIRAMEIIDELEPVARGPYTGCAGYLGFNRESQLSILIRTALITQGRAWYHAGAGIVADSVPAEEYAETLAKASGFAAALRLAGVPAPRP